MREWLKTIRVGKKLTQAEVATRAGITPEFYSMIESGVRTPSVVVAQKIADVLGFYWARFFEEKVG